EFRRVLSGPRRLFGVPNYCDLIRALNAVAEVDGISARQVFLMQDRFTRIRVRVQYVLAKSSRQQTTGDRRRAPQAVLHCKNVVNGAFGQLTPFIEKQNVVQPPLPRCRQFPQIEFAICGFVKEKAVLAANPVPGNSHPAEPLRNVRVRDFDFAIAGQSNPDPPGPRRETHRQPLKLRTDSFLREVKPKISGGVTHAGEMRIQSPIFSVPEHGLDDFELRLTLQQKSRFPLALFPLGRRIRVVSYSAADSHQPAPVAEFQGADGNVELRASR